MSVKKRFTAFRGRVFYELIICSLRKNPELTAMDPETV
jgi:hypothetical protein